MALDAGPREDLAEKGPREAGLAPWALVGPHGWLLRGDSSRSGLYFWFLEPKEVLPRGRVHPAACRLSISSVLWDQQIQRFADLPA